MTLLAIPVTDIVKITGGVADQTVVHLPARAAGGFTFARYTFPPATWPSACRRVASGSVYVHAGLLADVPVCRACEATL